MGLLKEIKKLSILIKSTLPNMYSKVFRENSGEFEMSTTQKYHPRKNHQHVKLHHFRNYITEKKISIHPINTGNQLRYYLTKPVNQIIRKRL